MGQKKYFVSCPPPVLATLPLQPEQGGFLQLFSVPPPSYVQIPKLRHRVPQGLEVVLGLPLKCFVQQGRMLPCRLSCLSLQHGLDRQSFGPSFSTLQTQRGAALEAAEGQQLWSPGHQSCSGEKRPPASRDTCTLAPGLTFPLCIRFQVV